jgi:hypothetical protein
MSNDENTLFAGSSPAMRTKISQAIVVSVLKLGAQK